MNPYYVTAYSIFGLGVFLFLFFIIKGYRNSTKGIDKYEKVRDELTLREPEEEENEDVTKSSGGFSLGNIIGGFIVLFVGVSLMGPITKELETATGYSNVTTSIEPVASTVLQFLPIFFIFTIVIVAFGIIFTNLRGVELV